MKRITKSIAVIIIALVFTISCDNSTTGGSGIDGPFVYGTGTPDTSWYTEDPDAGSFTINSPDELAGLAVLVNAGNDFSGKTIIQTADLNLSKYAHGEGWVPIGKYYFDVNFELGTAEWVMNSFKGVYDGNNKTIRGLVIDREEYYQGLFGHVTAGGELKNITLTMLKISNVHVYSGGIVGRLEDGDVVCHLFCGLA